jgi:hypothetical protein
MSYQTNIVPAGDMTRLIRSIRDRRVILDHDLAGLYGVPTKRLNEQYRRNLERFPEDFAFRLTQNEWAAFRSQVATLEIAPDLRSQNATSKPDGGIRSQFATASKRNIRYLPLPSLNTVHSWSPMSSAVSERSD